MRLTNAELDRLEKMIAEGRVRCDPAMLSATDLMLQRIAARHAPPPGTVVPAAAPPAACAQGGADVGMLRQPHSLQQLIAIRTSLLDDLLHPARRG